MLTWIIVIAVFGVLGVTGYYKGAVRSAVSLVGLCTATFLALPLAPMLKPLVPKVGLTNQLWSVVLPPVVVFLSIVLIFFGIAFLVHSKVSMHFKYATDDYTRIRWERLNQRVGACIGFVGASIYALVIGLVFYVVGYPAVQMTGDESPAWQRMAASVRKELQENGLDKTLASIDPMKDKYYLSSDLIGLLYQNPALLDRLLNYPAFLALSERPEIMDIVTDVEFLNSWQTRAPIMNLVNHPKVQGLINNADIAGEISQVDFKDLIQYLNTGKSAKYDEEKILGRWYLDASVTFTLARKQRPDMTAQEMAKLKTLVAVFLAKTSLMATPDNKYSIRVELTDQANRIIEAAKAAAAAALAASQAASGESPPPTMDPRMADRYFRGMRRGPGTPAPEQQPAQQTAAVELPGIPKFSLAGQGTWERDGTKYKLRLVDEKNQSHAGEAKADDERLLAELDGLAPGLRSLVFVR